MRWLLALALTACTASTAAPPAPALPSGFWDHWGDGKAEVSAYALTQPRYGEDRRGEAILVFVTENFDEAARVKSDRGGPGTLPVMKLNDIRDFQTGIYDYHAMTSVFVPLTGALPAGTPAKVSFSMQEWCGHMADQLVVRGDGVQRALHSYFEGEGDQVGPTDLPVDALYADALPVVARGLVGEVGLWSGAVVPRLLDLRLHHRPLGASSGELSVGPTQARTVPAGTFTVTPVTLTQQGGATTLYVETAPPHRVIGWERSDGEVGAMTGSLRTAYWNQAHEGAERLRAQLGLPARAWPAATPGQPSESP